MLRIDLAQYFVKWLAFLDSHGKIMKPRKLRKIWRRSGSPKGQKTPKKCPLCHFLDPQEPVLGEMIFEGLNQLQIRN